MPGKVEITIPYFLGLNTVHQPTMVHPRCALDLANVKGEDFVIGSRGGNRAMSASLSNQRSSGAYQWYPDNASAKDKIYTVFNGTIYRLILQPNGQRIPVAVTWPADIGEWAKTEFVWFCPFGNYLFIFNGVDAGIQINASDPGKAYAFMIAKPNHKILTAPAGAGSITTTLGGHHYWCRGVHELNSVERDYWGPLSDISDSTGNYAAQKRKVTFPIPTDEQVNAVYLYRSSDGETTPFFHARLTGAAMTSGVYIDDIADTNTEEMHRDVVDRIIGITCAVADDGTLVVFGSKDEPASFAYSWEEYPQEIDVDNNALMQDGTGPAMSIAAAFGNVYMMREKGINVYQKDPTGNYSRAVSWPSWGNIAPWSVKNIKKGASEYITFVDQERGPSRITFNGPESLMRIEQFIGKNEMATIDVENFFKVTMAQDLKKFISVGESGNQIYWCYTPGGKIRNTAALRLDKSEDRWYGPDTGYSIGPMITRMSGRGGDGKGELFGIDDTDSKLVWMDTSSKDFGSNIVHNVKSVKMGAAYSGRWFEMTEMYIIAQVANTILVKVNCYDNFEITYVLMSNGQVAVYDAGFFYGDVATYDQMKWRKYHIPCDESLQGGWFYVIIHKDNPYEFKVGEIYMAMESRGTIDDGGDW